ALLAVFGEPLRANDVPTLEAEVLAQAGMVVTIAQHAGINWQSPTLVADLKQALAASKERAQADPYGDPQTDPTTPPPAAGPSQGRQETIGPQDDESHASGTGPATDDRGGLQGHTEQPRDLFREMENEMGNGA